MPVEARRVFAQHVEVFAAVDIRQPVALAPRPGQRKRREIEHRAGIATGHVLGRLGLARRAFRVAGAILGLCLAKRLGEIGIRSDSKFHGVSS